MEITNNNGETVLGRQNITLNSTLTEFEMEFIPSQTFTLGNVRYYSEHRKLPPLLLNQFR